MPAGRGSTERRMTSTSFATLLAFALAAGAAHAQELAKPANPFVLRCGAPIALDSTHAKIVTAAGVGNVAFQRVDTGGGDKIGATVIYPKDPTRRLEVIWTDHKARAKPSTVRVNGKSQWAIDNGLRIGASITEVEALNRKPFRLYGFGWELGGVMLDWLDGALSRLPGGCSVQIRFGITDQQQPTAGHPAFGENELVSSNTAVRALAPTVLEFALSYPE
jgi:hypothetical protein